MIRRAEIRDAGRLNELLFQVQALHAAGRPDIFKTGARKYTDEALLEIIRDDRRPIYVEEADGIIRGYAFCVLQQTEENNQLHARKTLYIDDLCVDQRFRRQHIGEALYRYVRQAAADAGCDSVTLNVWALNASAARFYEKMGLRPLKTMLECRLD